MDTRNFERLQTVPFAVHQYARWLTALCHARALMLGIFDLAISKGSSNKGAWAAGGSEQVGGGKIPPVVPATVERRIREGSGSI